MHADGYAGFNDLYRSGKITEVACMTHIRRKVDDVHKSQDSAIAEEARKHISRLYGIEKEVRGQFPDQRWEARQIQSKPQFDDLEVWLHCPSPYLSTTEKLVN